MKLVHLFGDTIPEALQNIHSPPKNLYTTGNLPQLLNQPCLSVVGSRKPTPYGRQVAEDLVRELVSYGVVIVSGLAFGIDSVAHRACLAAGGKTIAVLPSSLDSVYPASHRQLAKQIVETGGALVSEYSDDNQAYKSNFIARNRIISGLSQGLLIIEAALASGTTHTANFALDQGRTVLAVPGNITSPMSAGTNRLLVSGALPVTETSDILRALGMESAIMKKQIVAASPEERTLIELMDRGITDASQLLAYSLLDSSIFNQTLTMLEIKGKIRPLGAGNWALN